MSVRSVLSPDKDKQPLLKFAASEVEQPSNIEDILRHVIIDFLTISFHDVYSLIEFCTYAEKLCSSGEFMGFYVRTSCPVVVFGTFKTIASISIVYSLVLGNDGCCSTFQESLCRHHECGNLCLLAFA